MVVILNFEPEQLVHHTMATPVARIALSFVSATLDISPLLLHRDEMRLARHLGSRMHRHAALGIGTGNACST